MSKKNMVVKPDQKMASDRMQNPERKLRDIRRYVNGVRVTNELGEKHPKLFD
jgi:hypothetical protein